jgi:hypothetical protein
MTKKKAEAIYYQGKEAVVLKLCNHSPTQPKQEQKLLL